MGKKDTVYIIDIVSALEESGFAAVRTVPTTELKKRLKEIPKGVRPHIGLPDPGTIIIAAFPYTRPEEPNDLSEPGNPHALIAPFARRHYYREAVIRMKALVGNLGLSGQSFRLFSNSRLPEKPMAAAAGLGFYGRNGLIITRETGSRFVIAGMITPLRSDKASHPPCTDPPGAYCGDCRLCVDACPVGALNGTGGLDRSLCLQALATEPGTLPEPIAAAWGKRLYGCDTCQEICPFNTSPRRDTPPITGKLGASIAVRDILEAGLENRLTEILRGSALGMSWMNTGIFLRNTLLTTSPDNPPPIELIRAYTGHPDPVLAKTARRVLDRLSFTPAPDTTPGEGSKTIT